MGAELPKVHFFVWLLAASWLFSLTVTSVIPAQENTSKQTGATRKSELLRDEIAHTVAQPGDVDEEKDTCSRSSANRICLST